MKGSNRIAGSNVAEHLSRQKAQEEEADFYKSLAALASVCRFVLTPEVVELYDRILSKVGYRPAVLAIQKVFATRKATDSFPSVSDLLTLADSRPTDQAAAVEIADRIWQAIAIFGYPDENGAKEKLGPIAAKVIEQVGWQELCSTTVSQATSVKAQLRESAKAILERERNQAIQKLLSGPDQPAIEQKAAPGALPPT